jgi:hypothetical protein
MPAAPQARAAQLPPLRLPLLLPKTLPLLLPLLRLMAELHCRCWRPLQNHHHRKACLVAPVYGSCQHGHLPHRLLLLLRLLL